MKFYVQKKIWVSWKEKSLELRCSKVEKNRSNLEIELHESGPKKIFACKTYREIFG